MINNQKLKYPPIKTSLKEESRGRYKLVINPLLPGFGYTLGNSIRRVFLSSIPGFAVTKVKINDITHEYQAVEGVIEDVIDIIFNLKKLNVKILGEEKSVFLSLSTSKNGEITASDFEKNASVEILNPEMYICTLNQDKELNLEVEVSRGFGYQPVESLEKSQVSSPQYIFVDAFFSPVKKVSLNVSKVRVGSNTNFDKIEVFFTTTENVEAKDIVEYVLSTCTEMFVNIDSAFQASLSSSNIDSLEEDNIEKDAISLDKSNKINLDPNKHSKILSILEKNGIATKSDLVESFNKGDIQNFSGVGEKTMLVIEEYINSL